MILIQLIEFIRQRIQIFVWGSYAVLALLIMVDLFPSIVNKSHAHTQIEYIPGFWTFFGFIACVMIIFMSKWLGHLGIMQNEDYYNEENFHG